MSPCPEHAEELAACAALSQSPSALLARHLEDCSDCRVALAELRAAAAIQVKAAADLPHPVLRSNLTPWFARSIKEKFAGSGSSHAFRFRAYALGGGAMAVVLLLGLFLSPREMPGPSSTGHSVRSSAAAAGALDFIGPTWHALGRQPEDLLGEMEYRGSGNIAGHYRVKDAYTELD